MTRVVQKNRGVLIANYLNNEMCVLTVAGMRWRQVSAAGLNKDLGCARLDDGKPT